MLTKYESVFRDCVAKIMEEGEEVSPRGQLTKELLSHTIKVNPLHSILVSKVRDINHSFLFAENLWYLSGRNSRFLLGHYNKNYVNFSDDGILQGAYGPQILEQIRYVVNTLKADQDSRQAVISLWRNNPSQAKDKPCTLNFHFMIRDGALNLHVQMRSNDAIWGQNYDVPSFSLLLLVIAGTLGVKPGHLFLTANSLHIYEKHFNLANEIISAMPGEFTTVELIEAPHECLEQQLFYVEEVLRAHYYFSGRLFYMNDFNHLPDFWKQYIGAMAYYKAYQFKSEEIMTDIFNYLNSANPSLGNMFHDKYETYLRKLK